MTEPTFGALVGEVRRRRRESFDDGSALPASALNLAVLRRVDSTNDLARRIRRELAVDDITVSASAMLAFEQTAGRGRQGRRWLSPPGRGVYATLVTRLAAEERLPVLPLAVGAALADAIDPHLLRPCLLKWPNDLVVGGRKVGGVLVESAVREGSPPDLIVGFGVNWGQRREELPVAEATSLLLEGAKVTLPELAWELVQAVAAELARDEPRAITVERWLARSVHRTGDRLVCRQPGEGKELVGRFLGLTPQGLLRLEVDGREEVLLTAEVGDA